jgi:cell division septation protein DedD
VRKLVTAWLILAVCACGRSDGGDASPPVGASPPSGPDPVIVRIPRDGGVARAFRYPQLDSLIWRGTQRAPALDRVLAFDAENGTLSFVDSAGKPGWIDLRVGSVRAATKATLTGVSSADGSAIFGISKDDELIRMTPSGDWTRELERPARRLFPLADGTLLVLAEEGEQRVLLRLRPPDDAITDSVAIPRPDRSATTALGDRVYFAVADQLLSVSPQSLEAVDRLTAADTILAIAPTPSGDRVFLANQGGTRLEVLDRYSAEVENSVTLPGLATELRMDALGRYLLARPSSGDSAWVVAIGTETLVGTVQTSWRGDLPAVTVDGLVATVRGADVAFVDPRNGANRQTVKDGASDIWFFALWNGFRPRAEGIDNPVSFSLGEGGRARAPEDSGAVEQRPVPTPAARDSVLRPTPPPASTTVAPPSPPPARDSWIVSFAAVLGEARAREIAATITVDGQHPRVVPGQTAGTTVYRVIFGPYNSKADAERMGRASKHNYWVYEGVP